MAKYHISEDGNPRPCRASKNPCRFGDDNAHYETKEDARDAYELEQKVLAYKDNEAQNPEKASIESLENILRDLPSSGLDLPRGEHWQTRRANFDRKMLTNDVKGAQQELQAWLTEAENSELSKGWQNALKLRSLASKSFINADPAKLEKHLNENYLRPHAVNPNDANEVRGAIVPKAEGWTVEGPELVHKNGMKLKMTPGYAAYSGWSIEGPEGWREKYFEKNSGLYPVGNRDLLDPRRLQAIASYGE